MSPNVKPHDCLLLYTLPRSFQSFRDDLEAGVDKDFSKGVRERHSGISASAVWRTRLQSLADLSERVMSEMAGLGLQVVRDAKGTDFALVNRHLVAILIAHWGDDRIEFHDRLYTIEEVTAQVSSSYQGLIDLTVCASFTLGDAVKRRSRACLVRINQKRTDAAARILLLRYIVRRLHMTDCSYLEAVEYVHRRINERLS